MKFGIGMFVTDRSAGPAEVAAEVEARGLDSFWVSEHSHIPLDTQFPLGGEVPREYQSMLDPFVALTAAAAVTQRIRLGTSILILPQRDPINCAKSAASVDLVSNGRLTLGVGAGWNEPELANHGTNPARRFKLMRERVEAMRAIWTHETAEYHGEFVDFEPMRQWPKPVQQQHPPVYVAGAAPGIIERVARYGDGWLPVVIPEANEFSANRMTPLAELADWLPRIRERAAEYGRPPPNVIVNGHLDADAYALYQSLGVEGVNFQVPSADFDAVRQALDTIQNTIATATGQQESAT